MATTARKAGGLDWRWIGIGTLIMVVLNFVAGLIVVPLLGDARLPATPDGVTAAPEAIAGGTLAVAALVSFLSFVIGGFIVGLRSAGRTILEPAISAAIAVLIGLLLAGQFSVGNLLAGGLVPFLAGLLGGWLGEKRQGRRTV